MIDLAKKYKEAKAIALKLMKAGDISRYIQVLAEIDKYQMQLATVRARR